MREISLHRTNSSLINQEEFTLIIFNPNLSIANLDETIYRRINDYVLFSNDQSQLLTCVQSLSEETILLAIFHASVENTFLSQLHNLQQINSIFILSSKEENDPDLLNKFSKMIGIYTDETLMLEQIRTYLEQQSTLYFAFYHPKQIFTSHTKLTSTNARFLSNLLEKDLFREDYSTDKQFMIDKCREYYGRNPEELINIELFEKTYEPTNAWQWYLKRCFISKQLCKAFKTNDIKQLKLFAFFIRDLSSTMQSVSSIDKIYTITRVSTNQLQILLENIGNLMIFNGYFLVNSSHDELVSHAQVLVQFEVINGSTATLYLVDPNTIIFDLGTTFQLDSFHFDEHVNRWHATLIVVQNNQLIAQNYILTKQQTMVRMTLPILMGELLLISTGSLSKAKAYFEQLKNEDEALIYHFYGNIDYKKGDYDSALEHYQLSYQLMISDERIRDSAFILHDIGYVYDMKKELKQALDCHRQALEIRQTHYPDNDSHIGISLYNIGRTLVTMDDHDQALDIWKQTLPPDHPFRIQSIHSHAVVYFNKGDYEQAKRYYQEALTLYETDTLDNQHGILMVF